jgi:hypothetical protein
MKRNRSNKFSRILGTDVFYLILSWAKGVWSSLKRFFRRLLFPNRGRRNRVEVQAENFHAFCPLIGVEKFRKAESLTVGELMSNVEWRGVKRNLQRRNPKLTHKTAPDIDLASIQAMSSGNYHICALAGVEQFRNAESLTVANLMENVQWRVPKSTKKTSSSSSSVSSVQKEINWD